MKASEQLDRIKNSWKELSKDKLKKDISVSDVQKMIRQKSKGELTKIKRKLLIETILSALLLPVYLVYIHRVNIQLAYLTDVFIITTIAALSWPTIRLLKIGKLQDQKTIVFLRKFVYHFEKAIKSAVILLLVLFPIYFIAAATVGFIQGYTMSGGGEPFSFDILTSFDQSTLLLGIAVLVVLLLISGFLFLIKLYYMLMYGKHVKNLKNFLQELEKQEMVEITNKKPNKK